MDRDPRIRWFGLGWGAHVNQVCPEAPTPVDDQCIYCPDKIAMGDRGILMWNHEGMRVPAHLGCFLSAIGVLPRLR